MSTLSTPLRDVLYKHRARTGDLPAMISAANEERDAGRVANSVAAYREALGLALRAVYLYGNPDAQPPRGVVSMLRRLRNRQQLSKLEWQVLDRLLVCNAPSYLVADLLAASIHSLDQRPPRKGVLIAK